MPEAAPAVPPADNSAPVAADDGAKRAARAPKAKAGKEGEAPAAAGDDDSAGDAPEAKAAAAKPARAAAPAAKAAADDSDDGQSLPGQDDVESALDALAPRVRGCFVKYQIKGTARVRLVATPAGKAESINVTGEFEDTPTGLCVESVLSEAKLPTFKGPPLKLSQSYQPSGRVERASGALERGEAARGHEEQRREQREHAEPHGERPHEERAAAGRDAQRPDRGERGLVHGGSRRRRDDDGDGLGVEAGHAAGDEPLDVLAREGRGPGARREQNGGARRRAGLSVDGERVGLLEHQVHARAHDAVHALERPLDLARERVDVPRVLLGGGGNEARLGVGLGEPVARLARQAQRAQEIERPRALAARDAHGEARGGPSPVSAALLGDLLGADAGALERARGVVGGALVDAVKEVRRARPRGERERRQQHRSCHPAPPTPLPSPS